MNNRYKIWIVIIISVCTFIIVFNIDWGNGDSKTGDLSQEDKDSELTSESDIYGAGLIFPKYISVADGSLFLHQGEKVVFCSVGDEDYNKVIIYSIVSGNVQFIGDLKNGECKEYTADMTGDYIIFGIVDEGNIENITDKIGLEYVDYVS